VRTQYEALLARFDRAARWAIIATTAAMIVVVSVQVFLRYIFNTSIDWSDEISRLLFVWCMFLAIPLGIREGSHVGVELLVTHFPQTTKRNIARVMSVVSIGLMAIVLYQTVIVSWDELLPTVNLSANWFLVPLAICAFHSILHLVQLLWHEPVRSIATME
jgi:TRAP-type transport system small permease protein